MKPKDKYAIHAVDIFILFYNKKLLTSKSVYFSKIHNFRALQ
jgi:hypothetical protein